MLYINAFFLFWKVVDLEMKHGAHRGEDLSNVDRLLVEDWDWDIQHRWYDHLDYGCLEAGLEYLMP